MREKMAHAVVFWFDLDAPLLTEEKALAVLDPQERHHLRTFGDARVAARFMQRRVARRLILAAHAEVSPAEIVYSGSATGKPALADRLGNIAFSPSSSGSLGIVAVSEGGPIGADVEVDRPIRSDLLARSILAPAEAHAFANLSSNMRKGWVLQRWTIKEAVVKTLGTGLEVHALSGIDTSTICQNGPPAPVRLSSVYKQFAPVYAASATAFIPGQHEVSIALAATSPVALALADGNALIR